MGCPPDHDRHTDHIGRTEKSPCCLVIEQDPVLHQIIVRKIVPVHKFQRMEIEEIPADTDGIDCDTVSRGRKIDASHSAVAFLDQARTIFDLGLG